MDNLKDHFTTCSLIPDLKRQRAYLSLKDTDIAFDEVHHIYLLPHKNIRFPISVTGFCKAEIHGTSFDPVKIIRNVNIHEDWENGFDMHIVKLLEWKYSSVFGSLFHAIIEYFFNFIVNNCKHDECKKQMYNESAYYEYLMDATNTYNLDMNKLSQSIEPSKEFNIVPTMPCRYAVRDFKKFMDIILDKSTFEKFIHNNHRFNMDNEKYIKDIVNTMELAFEGDSPLKGRTLFYRQKFKDLPYEFEVDKVIAKYYTLDRCIQDLEQHLTSFRQILIHLPLHICCDIFPEYITFDEEKGLAGSVDLTMRSRYDPRHLLIYDWKTCKKIFNTFYRHEENTNQLMEYSCQLHTYANLINKIDPNFTFDLFVVNITSTDSCIYSTKNYQDCKCNNIFENFNMTMYEYSN